jgi:hypothetical protein
MPVSDSAAARGRMAMWSAIASNIHQATLEFKDLLNDKDRNCCNSGEDFGLEEQIIDWVCSISSRDNDLVFLREWGY